MNINRGNGKEIWKCIKYLRNDNRLTDADFVFSSGKEWWEYWNESRVKRYSYKWVCKWISENPEADVWDELFMSDAYLALLCKQKKVSMYDQLVYYADEWYSR